MSSNEEVMVRIFKGDGVFDVDVYDAVDLSKCIKKFYEEDKKELLSSGYKIDEGSSFCDDRSAFLTAEDIEIHYEVVLKKDGNSCWYEFRVMNPNEINIRRYNSLDELLFSVNILKYQVDKHSIKKELDEKGVWYSHDGISITKRIGKKPLKGVHIKYGLLKTNGDVVNVGNVNDVNYVNKGFLKKEVSQYAG